MSTTAPFTLGTALGTTLNGLVDLPDEPGERPAIVVCHGFKGFMEWGFFPYLGALLADRGFVVIRFDLSGAGRQPGDDLVTDPAAFRSNTHSREVSELLAVLEAIDTIVPGRIDPARLGLFGHSRGGGNAVLAAARSPWRERIGALVTWAAVSTFDRYTPEQKEDWRLDGELPVVNARTGQQLALGLGLLEDLETHSRDLDILAAAKDRRAPWLIVHGEDDESVPIFDGERLAAASSGGHELLRIAGANHTFGARHPFVGPTPQLIEALNATQRWFRRYLAAG